MGTKMTSHQVMVRGLKRSKRDEGVDSGGLLLQVPQKGQASGEVSRDLEKVRGLPRGDVRGNLAQSPRGCQTKYRMPG